MVEFWSILMLQSFSFISELLWICIPHALTSAPKSLRVCVYLREREKGWGGGREREREREVSSRCVNDDRYESLSNQNHYMADCFALGKIIKWLTFAFSSSNRLWHLPSFFNVTWFPLSAHLHQWRPRCSVFIQSHSTPWAGSKYTPPQLCQLLLTFPILLRGQKEKLT